MEEEVSQSQTPQSQEVKWYTPLTRVTPLSHALTLTLLVVLPVVGLWMGLQQSDLGTSYTNVSMQSVVTDELDTQSSQDVKFHYIPGIDSGEVAQLLDGYYVQIYGGKLVRYRQGKGDEKNRVTDLEVLADYEVSTSSWSHGDFLYDEGRVLDYWVSPDKQRIAYLIQAGIGACCGPATPSHAGSVDRLMVMHANGGGKIMIDNIRMGGETSGRQDVLFNGWMWDSQRFVFYERSFDEATSGSGFYVGTVGTSTIVPFVPLTTGEEGSQIVARAEPHFSPTDDLMVYIPGGIDGDTIILSKTDGSDQKVLMPYTFMKYLKIEWSDDGETVHVNRELGNEGYVFTKAGREVTNE